MDDGGNVPKARRKAELHLKLQKRFEQAKTSDVFKQEDDESEPEETTATK